MLKHYYENETDIPDNLKGAYVAKGGRYELAELDKDHPVVKKNKELLGTNSTLTSQNNELLHEKVRLETSSLPEGKVAVEPEIEKLGNAAKAANLKASEIPALSEKVNTLQTQIDSFGIEKTIDEVASDNKYNARFKQLAKEKGLKFEKGTEKVDGKEMQVWNVVGENNVKSKISDFLTTDSFFKEFADTFTDNQQQTRRFAPQVPDSRNPPQNKFDAIREQKQAEQKPVTGGMSVTDRFYNRQPAQTE